MLRNLYNWQPIRDRFNTPYPDLNLPTMSLIYAAVFVLFLALCTYYAWLPVAIDFYIAAVSCLTFCLYGWDKFAARRNIRRIRENTLHFYGLVGGWPGAVLAQEWFRHKTQKTTFRKRFWVTVAINSLLVGLFLTPPGQAWLEDWVPFLQEFIWTLGGF